MRTAQIRKTQKPVHRKILFFNSRRSCNFRHHGVSTRRNGIPQAPSTKRIRAATNRVPKLSFTPLHPQATVALSLVSGVTGVTQQIVVE